MISIEKEQAEQLLDAVKTRKDIDMITYRNAALILTQEKEIMSRNLTEEEKKRLQETFDRARKDGEMSDVDWHRYDKLQQVLCGLLDIPYENETLEEGGADSASDDNTADKPSAEVSEDTEVLPKEGE